MNLRVKHLALFISFSAACLSSSYSANATETTILNGSQTQAERARPPRDLTPPVITLNGDAEMTIYQGSDFTDPLATAVDAVDGPINVTVRGWVNINRPGTYTITYSAVDSKGNKATAKRKVIVIPDAVAPVIQLNGSSSMSLIQNGVFDDPGASATDNLDGDLRVRVIGRVRRNIPGVYTLTYLAKDSAGNEASVTRTVTVVADTIAPVISLLGDSVMTVTLGANFIDPGAEATDNSGVLVNITTFGRVNTARLGEYQLSYRARDRSGNISTVTRLVKVVAVTPVDTIPPVITLNGASTIEVTVGDTYVDAGATATDNVDGNLAVTTSGTVDTSRAGSYTLSYTATDSAGNSTNLTRSIIVKPVANLSPTANAGANQTVNEQTTVNLNGTASSDSDGSISQYLWEQTAGQSVTLNNANSAQASFNAPDISTTETFTFKLTVTDNQGASASATTSVTVNPVDNVKPVISLIGSAAIEITVGDEYIDQGATASDDVDTTVTVTTTGSVNTAQAGVYTLQYHAQDAAGNQADPVTRTVTVKTAVVTDTVPPVITLQGLDKTYHYFDPDYPDDNPYVDPGATAIDDIDGSVTVSTTGAVANALGTYTLEYTASDAANNQAHATRIVKLVNSTPLYASAGADQTRRELETISLDGSSSGADTDNGYEIVSYEWQQVQGTTVTISNPQAAVTNFIAPDLSATEDMVFRLTVTDNYGFKSTATTQIKVINLLSPTPQATGKLNDTGLTTCGDDSASQLTCPVSTHPNQDAQNGRDFTANDPLDGYAGFSFTKLDSQGVPLADQTADYSQTPWSCVKDNVTGLIWEVKTNNGDLHDVNWTYGAKTSVFEHNCSLVDLDCTIANYIEATNESGFCGANDWRQPSLDELFGLVALDKSSTLALNAESVAIDTNYFPHIRRTSGDAQYWSSDLPYVRNQPYYNYFVNFNAGSVQSLYDFTPMGALLVRGSK